MRVVDEPTVSWECIVFYCQQPGCGCGVMFEKSDLRDTLRIKKPPRERMSGEYTARALCPHCNHPNALFVGRRDA